MAAVDRIDELAAELERCRAAMRRAQDTYNEAVVARLTERLGVAVGTRIRYRGKVWLVTQIDPAFGAWSASLSGRQKTKTGWHATERWIGYFNVNEKVDIVDV